tara:strand:+ start:475 stop:600 length:126 start_codon:yes stop_codon:yes gene_type:complete
MGKEHNVEVLNWSEQMLNDSREERCIMKELADGVFLMRSLH